MIDLDLRMLVFSCMININKINGKRYVTERQLEFYFSLIDFEFAKRRISVRYDVDWDNFRFCCGDLVSCDIGYVDKDSRREFICFMLPWVDIDDLECYWSGPILYDVFEVINSSNIINKVIDLELSRYLIFDLHQKKFEQNKIIQLRDNIEYYLQIVDVEKKKLDNYELIKKRRKSYYEFDKE